MARYLTEAILYIYVPYMWSRCGQDGIDIKDIATYLDNFVHRGFDIGIAEFIKGVSYIIIHPFVNACPPIDPY